MSRSDTELRTSDGKRLDWTSSSEAYGDLERDAYLAKVLEQLQSCRSTAVDAARFQRTIKGSSAIGQKLARLATARVSDKEMATVANSNDWVRQAALASNPYLLEDHAHTLMNSTTPFVRLQLAGNRSAPDVVLRRLQRDPDTDVARSAEHALMVREQPAPSSAERSEGSTAKKKKRRRR